MKRTFFFLVACLLVIPVFADSGANHQKQNNNYGVSGGNVNDITKSFCCSGTLGSLVSDGSTQYILSNNHVLARVDQATAGEDISQPGLIDNGCRVPRIVADYFGKTALGSNVDAAVATLRSGTMNTSGNIEDVGQPSTATSAPTVGMSVAKSGRTTGFTTGTIGSINTSVSVQYQKNCGSGKKFTVKYTNQVVINSSTFSAGGDSGSLIVTNTTCHHPVALLFAGSSSTTIGNPIREVLTKLGQSTGKTYSFVGKSCTGARLAEAESWKVPSQADVERVSTILESHRKNLMSQAAVIGVGVGYLAHDSSKAAIVIYMDKTQASRARLPQSIDGVPLRVISTDPFRAF